MFSSECKLNYNVSRETHHSQRTVIDGNIRIFIAACVEIVCRPPKCAAGGNDCITGCLHLNLRGLKTAISKFDILAG
jgi:hypothetical protein